MHSRASTLALTRLARLIGCAQLHSAAAQLSPVVSRCPTKAAPIQHHDRCRGSRLATLIQAGEWQPPCLESPCLKQQYQQQRHLQHYPTHQQQQFPPSVHPYCHPQAPDQQQQWQQQWQQQLRWCSTEEAARRRLLAAQQRRQRQQEIDERRAAAAGAAISGQQEQLQPAPPPAAAATVDTHTTAIAPQETVPSAVQVQHVVGHEALIVTRSVEWGTVLLGFEQATKYTVYDERGDVVALIAEDITGIGNELQRQLLRTRRAFTSAVLSADGSQVVFRVRRPAYLINSYMYIEDPQGQVIGEVRQRWHPWRRMYDLYIGKRQFAAVNSGFLAWEFEMKDAQGNTLALIDRNFIGFAKELFTDAGKYVVHFGYSPERAADMCSRTLQIRSGKEDVAVTPLAQIRTDVAVIPTYTGNQLVVQQPLPLSERLIALAAAISVDYNYFSRLSSHSGFFSPPLFMPIPVPSGGVGGVGTGAGSAAEGAAGVGTTAAGAEAAAGAGGINSPSAPVPDQSPTGFSGTDDAGFSSGLGSQGFTADDADSFRWDTDSGGGGGGDEGGWGSVLGGGGGGGGDDEGSSGLWGILVGIWAMIFGE